MSKMLRWTDEQLAEWQKRNGRPPAQPDPKLLDALDRLTRPKPRAQNVPKEAPPPPPPSAASGREVALWLPWPPSVNTYWRHPKEGPAAGRHLISEKGRAYCKAVLSAVPAPVMLVGRLHATLIYWPPDRRVRDIDNFLKAPLDALRRAGIYRDDSQIKRLVIDFDNEPRKGGRLYILIREV